MDSPVSVQLANDKESVSEKDAESEKDSKNKVATINWFLVLASLLSTELSLLSLVILHKLI